MSCGVHQKLDQAILEHKNGNLEKAEVIYLELLKDQPLNQDIYYYLGNLKISLNKFKDAEDNFRKAIELKPDFFQAQMNLANTLKELNKLQESEEIYKKVTKSEATHYKAYFNLGCLYQQLGRLKEAEENFYKAIRIKPDFFQAYMNLGSVLKNLYKFNEAENIYKKAIELKPNFEKAYNNLGIVQVDTVKLKEAEENFKKAINLNSNIKESYINLDLVLKQKELLSILHRKKGRKLKKNKNIIPNFFITKLKVDSKLITNLYKIKKMNLDKTIKYDARYGNGMCSSDFNLFKTNSNLKKVEKDLTNIMESQLKSEVYIIDSFFNILKSGSGTTPHNHVNQFDKNSGLIDQKYSLTYYLSIGDQNSNEPGILKLYEPGHEILPEKGMIVIIPASRKHSAVYDGKKDRVMIGINFYTLV
mgnify:FL=1|tara:strand:- start:92 stop:1345 length:1254 start_codon:yes stop_codon:yes gene_type:complete